MCVTSTHPQPHPIAPPHSTHTHLHTNAACCRVLRVCCGCVAVCCSALQYLTVCFSALQCVPRLYPHTTRHHYPILPSSSFTPPLCVAVSTNTHLGNEGIATSQQDAPWLFTPIIHTPSTLCMCLCVPQRIPMRVPQHIPMCAMTHTHVCHDVTTPLSTHSTPNVPPHVCAHGTMTHFDVCPGAYPSLHTYVYTWGHIYVHTWGDTQGVGCVDYGVMWWHTWVCIIAHVGTRHGAHRNALWHTYTPT